MIKLKTTIQQEINQANMPLEIKEQVVVGTHELELDSSCYDFGSRISVDVIEPKEDGSNGWDISDCGFSLIYKLDNQEIIKMEYSDEIGTHLKSMEVLNQQGLSDLITCLSIKSGMFN